MFQTAIPAAPWRSAIGRLPVALLAGAILSSAPASAQSSGGAPAVLDKLYEGVVSTRVIPPEGSGFRARSDHGNGTAILRATGKGAAQLVLNGTVLADGDVSFMAAGRLKGAVWEGRSDSFTLRLDEKGALVGRGDFAGMQTSFDGTYKNNDLRLVVEIVSRSETNGGMPPGTRFQILYKLRHFPPSSNKRTGSASGGCREVVYRLKLTPNLFGSGLSSVRVPECVR